MDDLSICLANYRKLVSRVDEHCASVFAKLGESIICKPGCHGCCRHLSLFPVEAMAIGVAVGESSPEKKEHIHKRALSQIADKCPLLEDGVCLLYAARPIICRTHGFPLIAGGEGGQTLDFCPKNFIGVTSFPSSTILNLELLNTTLSAINSLFISSGSPPEYLSRERFSMSETILLAFRP